MYIDLIPVRIYRQFYHCNLGNIAGYYHQKIPIGFYAKERVYEAEKGTAKNDLDKIREGRELAKLALRLKKQRQQGL